MWPGRADHSRIERPSCRYRQEVLQKKGLSESRYASFPASEGDGLPGVGKALTPVR
jgi:hypothetical protein